MLNRLIIAGVILASLAGLYWRHSYLISALEAEREKSRTLVAQVEKSEAEARRARATLETERRLSDLMIRETERITHVLTVEKEVIRTVQDECLDTAVPADILRLLHPDRVSQAAPVAGPPLQPARYWW